MLAAVLAAALCAALLFVRPPGARSIPQTVPPAEPPLPAPRSFRFRDGYLVEGTEGADFLLPRPVNQVTAWADLAAALSAIIPDADGAMERTAATGERFHLRGRLDEDPVHVIGLRDGADVCVTFAVGDAEDATLRLDLSTLGALEAETNLLHRSQDASPSLSWVLDRDGRVIWGNARYIAEVARAKGAEAATSWPLHALFPQGQATTTTPVRRSLPGGRGKPERWFEVIHTPMRGGLSHAHAQPLNRLIEAESNLRTFITTLTRTFAALPMGLAIFDHDRQLAIYNPLFLDMTGLDGAWLASKPAMVDVLDALRDRQSVPEPRDWRAWRDSILAAADADAEGEGGGIPGETWTQPNGQSLRMTARAQGGGSVALLLEDVTDEIALARRRRSDAEALASLLEGAPDPSGVFAQDGDALHLNGAMRAITGFDTAETPSLDLTLARLATVLGDSEAWASLRRTARAAGMEPSRNETRVALRDGTAWATLTTLSGGRCTLALGGIAAGRDGSDGDSGMPRMNAATG